MKKLFKKVALMVMALFTLSVATGTVREVKAAEEETITFSEKGYANAEDLVSITQGDVTVTFSKGMGSNQPKYYTSGYAGRFYASNTLSFTSKKTMESITFNFTTSGYTGTLDPSVGLYSVSSKVGTWKGNSTSVLFTNNASGQARIVSIVVSFVNSSSSLEVLPSVENISFDSGIISWDAVENASSYYVSLTDSSGNEKLSVLEVETNSINVGELDFGTYTFVVYPKGDGINYSDGTAVSYDFIIKTYMEEIYTFTSIEGYLEENGKVSYKAEKGSAGTPPAVNGGEIRVYQNGGLFTVSALEGYSLTRVALGSSMSTTIAYAFDGSTSYGSNEALTADSIFVLDDIKASSVTFKCNGTDQSSRLYVNFLGVDYEEKSMGQEYVDNAISNLSLDVNSFYSENASINLPISYSNGATYSYSLNSSSNSFELINNTLTVKPTSTFEKATISVIANYDDYASNPYTFDINSCLKDSIISIEDAILIANCVGSKYTVDKFFVEGTISSIADTNYGNMNITNETSQLYLYGLYSSDGSVSYADMDVQPVEGDDIKVYGILGTYNSSVQMKAAWLIEHTSNSTMEEVDIKVNTTASLGFDYSYSKNTSNTATLVTNIDELKNGTTVIIAANGYDVAMSTTQNANNRGESSVTKSDNSLSFDDTAQLFTLGVEEIDGIKKYTLHTGDGFIHAASSSSNYLRTQEKITDDAKWTIDIDLNGVASIISQGSNTRNTLQYNLNSKLFSCYGSATQKALSIYKCDLYSNLSFDNISILFGAEVDSSLISGEVSNVGVMFSTGDTLNKETAKKTEIAVSEPKDGIYSVGAKLEIFANDIYVNDSTKSFLSQNITAAVYFVIDGEILVLYSKTVSVKSMVNTYINEYYSDTVVSSHIEGLKALQSYIG